MNAPTPDTGPGDELLQKLRRALVSDFKDLYVKEYTTDYKAKRIVRSVEVDVMQLNHVLELINRLMLTREREALMKLKQYNGAYIGIGGKRVDSIVHHQVIDEAIAVIDAQLNKEEK